MYLMTRGFIGTVNNSNNHELYLLTILLKVVYIILLNELTFIPGLLPNTLTISSRLSTANGLRYPMYFKYEF